jgi:hypothetical protein
MIDLANIINPNKASGDTSALSKGVLPEGGDVAGGGTFESILQSKSMEGELTAAKLEQLSPEKLTAMASEMGIKPEQLKALAQSPTVSGSLEQLNSELLKPELNTLKGKADPTELAAHKVLKLVDTKMPSMPKANGEPMAKLNSGQQVELPKASTSLVNEVTPAETSELSKVLQTVKKPSAETATALPKEVAEKLAGKNNVKAASLNDILKPSSNIDSLKAQQSSITAEQATKAQVAELSSGKKLVQTNQLNNDIFLPQVQAKQSSFVADANPNKKKLLMNMDVEQSLNKVGMNSSDKKSALDGIMKAYQQGQEDSLIRRNTSLTNSTPEMKTLEGMNFGAEGTMDQMMGDEMMTQIDPRNSQMDTKTSANNVKVMDLSNIDAKNTAELIDKITTYIDQAVLKSEGSLDLMVKHDSLGTFQIKAQRDVGQMIDLKIISGDEMAHKFFTQNEAELLKSLDQAGVKVNNLKLANSSIGQSINLASFEGKNDFTGDQSFSQNNQSGKGFGKQSQSEFNDGGQQRRKDLWEEYRQRYGA